MMAAFSGCLIAKPVIESWGSGYSSQLSTILEKCLAAHKMEDADALMASSRV